MPQRATAAGVLLVDDAGIQPETKTALAEGGDAFAVAAFPGNGVEIGEIKLGEVKVGCQSNGDVFGSTRRREPADEWPILIVPTSRNAADDQAVQQIEDGDNTHILKCNRVRAARRR